jgi:hypothetical protein
MQYTQFASKDTIAHTLFEHLGCGSTGILLKDNGIKSRAKAALHQLHIKSPGTDRMAKMLERPIFGDFGRIKLFWLH